MSNELKLLKLRDKNSSFVIRSPICTLHNFYNKCLVDKDIRAFDGIFKGSEVSLLISSLSLEHSHGVTPTTISYKMMPIAKMSLCGEYKFLINASGGM
jgi:hypothetical protein